ncbi:MAG TPA: TMEM175 family protein [Thermomicrobiales bacterium]|nr:TMEM175 family protein [Thermomicrobiales bacterium]
MGSASEESKRRGFERFLLFTDAVVAIAVTLLILPVVDEVLQPEASTARTVDLLSELAGELFGFLLSFTVIVVLWVAHQQVYSIAGTPTPWLMRLNAVWLLSITLLPFTTALIADHSDEQATVLLYVGNVALSIYCLGASFLVLARNPDLLLPGSAVTIDDWLDAILNCALVTLAFLLAVLVPRLGFYVMLVLFLANPLKRFWSRRVRR